MAIRELAPQIVQNTAVLPIIEPVSIADSQRLSLAHYTEENLRFMLITNPRVGDLAGNTDAIDASIVRSILDEYENYIPAMYVDVNTSIAQLDLLVSSYGDVPVAAIYCGQPNESVIGHLVNHDAVEWHVFLDGFVPSDFISRFPAIKRVLIRDTFRRRARNADYPADEFFSDMHRTVLGRDFAGFGDYSIAGAAYTGGGPAYAVALHHVYRNDAQSGNIHIRHFISDRTDSTADPSGKFIEALAKLVTALPGLGRFNHTATCNEYMSIYRSQQSPGLGYAKKLAIKHHIELMMKILDAAVSSPRVLP